MSDGPKLVPSYYRHGDKETDFGWMIDQPAYADALFVFNDNEQQFLAFQSGDRQSGCSIGAGNGAIRPYQCKTPPRAAGVPTGPGYDALTPATQKLIDRATAYVASVAKAQSYARVFYSATPNDPDMIGVSTFSAGDDVRRYCVTSLRNALGAAAAPAIQAANFAPIPTPQPQPVSVNGASYRLVAFYYPGYNEPWDDVYQAPFCGNYWERPVTLTIGGVAETFHTGEAAFQSTKWWRQDTIRKGFAKCKTGDEAYRFKKDQSDPDYSYAGLGGPGASQLEASLAAMRKVLDAKFADPDLGSALLATKDAYLLEHAGDHHDAIWSDHGDGAGANNLGLKLMEVRASLGGAGAPSGNYSVIEFRNAVKQ